MKCPRCQNDNYEGARFCTACGCTLPRESRASKFFTAALHAFLYFGLYSLIQLGVSFGYEVMLLAQMMEEQILVGGALSEEIILQLTNDVIALTLAHQYSLMLLSALITVLILVFTFRLRKRDAIKELHIRPVPLARVPWYVLLGVSLQPAARLLLTLLPQKWLQNFADTNPLNQTSDPLAVELISAIIAVPVLEELIFRALMFPRLRRGMGTFFAVLVTAGTFGAIHGHPVSFVYASVLAVVMTWLMIQNNESVIASILCHAGFNAGNYLLSLLFERTENELLITATLTASLAMVILSSFMTFRPIPDKE